MVNHHPEIHSCEAALAATGTLRGGKDRKPILHEPTNGPFFFADVKMKIFLILLRKLYSHCIIHLKNQNEVGLGKFWLVLVISISLPSWPSQ